jgi:hypothetical protein
VAVCRECGRQVRDDAWVCGLCGAPLTHKLSTSSVPSDGYASPPSASGHQGPPSGRERAAASATFAGMAAASGRSPRRILLVGIFGAVAVLAIVLVWLVALRDGSGTGFVGTWQAKSSQTTRVIIQRSSDAYQLSLTGTDGRTFGPFTATVEGSKLSTRLDPIPGASAQVRAAATLFKALFGNTGQEFTMVFTYRPQDDTLLLSIAGVAATAGHTDVLARVR